MKLIVLRGPSGSGKSTVARMLRDSLGEPAALVGQDHFRRVVLKEKNIPNAHNHELIKQVVFFALKRNFHVVLEGILGSSKYERMFEEILRTHPEDNHFFHFDVSFEETLRRHQTKPNRHEFGEAEMRKWYKRRDLLSCHEETIIPELDNADKAVDMIMRKIFSSCNPSEIHSKMHDTTHVRT